MGKIQINFYQIKCEALVSFYDWVNQGSEYNIAVDQSAYYDYQLSERIEKNIRDVTVATRFVRCGKPISGCFKEDLESSIYRVNVLDLDEYGMADEEIALFEAELEEVKTFLKRPPMGWGIFKTTFSARRRENQSQKLERAGRKINFYKTQYEALETFYGWIDRGNAFDVAVEQSNGDWCERNEIERIILNITIACECWLGEVGSFIERFQKELELYISKAKGLDLQEYGFTDEEIEDFGEDLRFAEKLLRRHDKEYEKSEQT